MREVIVTIENVVVDGMSRDEAARLGGALERALASWRAPASSARAVGGVVSASGARAEDVASAIVNALRSSVGGAR